MSSELGPASLPLVFRFTHRETDNEQEKDHFNREKSERYSLKPEEALCLFVWSVSVGVVVVVCLFCFVLLGSPGYPGTHSVDHVGLELRDPPASASPVQGLKVCATKPCL